jgi:hypothetical protein
MSGPVRIGSTSDAPSDYATVGLDVALPPERYSVPKYRGRDGTPGHPDGARLE